jgi:hypothetical protein
VRAEQYTGHDAAIRRHCMGRGYDLLDWKLCLDSVNELSLRHDGRLNRGKHVTGKSRTNQTVRDVQISHYGVALAHKIVELDGQKIVWILSRIDGPRHYALTQERATEKERQYDVSAPLTIPRTSLGHNNRHWHRPAKYMIR